MNKKFLGILIVIVFAVFTTGCHVPLRSFVERQLVGSEESVDYEHQKDNTQLVIGDINSKPGTVAPTTTPSTTTSNSTTSIASETTTPTSLPSTTTTPTSTPSITTTSTSSASTPTNTQLTYSRPPATADASGCQTMFVGLPEYAEGAKIVSLTFDDGPRPDTTGPLLDILKTYNVKATFCMVGWRIQGNEALVKRMVDEGHLLCNHSWDHPNLTELTDEEVIEQITKTDNAIYQATGLKAPLIRPPYGAYDDNTNALIDKPVLMWNLDTRDWESRDTDEILDKINSEIKSGDCLLFHDIYEPSVEAVRILIPQLMNQGYVFVRTDELLTADGTPLTNGHVYHQAPILPEPTSTTGIVAQVNE